MESYKIKKNCQPAEWETTSPEWAKILLVIPWIEKQYAEHINN